MIETELAWAAGIVDGEGCVTILQTSPSKRNGYKNVTYRPSIAVAMSHSPTVEKLYNIFGGNINISFRQNRGFKNLLIWYCRSRKAIEVINMLIPYLVCKKDEAILVSKFYDCDDNARKNIFQSVKALKKRNYNEHILQFKKIRGSKYKTPGHCAICAKPIAIYHKNGRKKYCCSYKCSAKFRVNNKKMETC